jgi:transcription antitermination factor NusG
LTTPGVAAIVGNGKAPVAVSDVEVAALKGLVRSGLDAEPWPYLEIGSRVRIEEGPLYGVEGVLLTFKQQYRLVLSVTLLRRSVAVEVDARWVKPAKFGAAAASE